MEKMDESAASLTCRCLYDCFCARGEDAIRRCVCLLGPWANIERHDELKAQIRSCIMNVADMASQQNTMLFSLVAC